MKSEKQDEERRLGEGEKGRGGDRKRFKVSADELFALQFFLGSIIPLTSDL